MNRLKTRVSLWGKGCALSCSLRSVFHIIHAILVSPTHFRLGSAFPSYSMHLIGSHCSSSPFMLPSSNTKIRVSPAG